MSRPFAKMKMEKEYQALFLSRKKNASKEHKPNTKTNQQVIDFFLNFQQLSGKISCATALLGLFL